MPTVIESIALEIVRRLEQIHTDNDYSFDCCNVVRPDRQGESWTPEDGLIVVTQGDSTRNPSSDYPGNPPAIAYETEFEINCFVRDSDFAKNDIDPEQNDRGSQLVKAITTEATDPTMWYTMGGFAVIAEMGDIKSYPQSEGVNNGVTLVLKVMHRQSENNPYQVRA